MKSVKVIVDILFVALFLLITFFGIGPVLFADGSDRERMNREFDTCLNINCIRSLDTAYFFVKFYNFILRTLSYCVIIKGVR